MENGQKKLPGKKEALKQIADKMETALPELKEMLGEKKFMNRVKKAAKLLMAGSHKEDTPKKKEQPAKKATAAKKAAIKQSAKKANGKQAAAKKATSPKKAKQTKAGK